jgi:drug/metabolite transporter (DMT)-like permease
MSSAPVAAPSSARLSPFVIACLAATWIIWGSTYLAIKWALVSFPPYWQMGTRFLVAGLLLLLFMRWRGSPWPTARQWRNAAVIGGLMLAFGMGNTANSEKYVASGLVVAFIAICPALMALMNYAYGIKSTRVEILGIVIGLVGVLLLTQGSGFSSSALGLIAVISACTCWTLGSVLSQQQFKLAPGPMGFASEMLMGGTLLMLMSYVAHEQPTLPPDARSLWSWGYLIVFGSFIAFNAYMALLARASAALASSYTYVNPVIAMGLGILLDGEVVTSFEWLATLVILVGVVLMVFGRR